MSHTRLALTVCYALLVLAAGAGAFYSLTLRCEGFGCTGIGILWMTWAAVLFAPTLALGCYLAMRPNQRDGYSRFSQWLLGAQVALGLGLCLYWLFPGIR